MKKLILLVSLLILCTNAFAIKITKFLNVDTYIRCAEDIVIARIIKTSEPEKWPDGLYHVNVEILSVLKGTMKPGEKKITTIYSIEEGRRYLLANSGGSAFGTDFLAIAELTVIEIPKYFDIGILEGKTLRKQLKLIIEARCNQLESELHDLEEEKELLEKALLSIEGKRGIVGGGFN